MGPGHSTPSAHDVKGIDFASCSLLVDRAPGLHSPSISLTRVRAICGLSKQTRLSLEDHIAGPWHIVPLQESVEFLQHEVITRQFHAVFFRGGAILFNKDTCEPDFQVKSAHVPADKADCSGWAFEAVVSKARFRRIPRKGKFSFTVMSLHCHICTATKLRPRSAKNVLNVLLAVRTATIQHDIGLVAVDFNGANWRRRAGLERQYDSTLEEALKKARLLLPPAPDVVGSWWYSK